MTRVTHVITSLETGGAQRMLVKLLRAQRGGKFESRVVSLLGDGPLRAPLERSGVDVLSLGMRPGIPDPRAVLRLARELRKQPPQLLQTWLYHGDLVGTLAGRRAGIERIAWNLRRVHGSSPGDGLAARLAPKLCARLSTWPSVIVTNSEAGRLSHEAAGYRPRRWALIPNGFDLERYRPDPGAGERLREELGLAAEDRLCGVVARFHPIKNHEGLLRVAARAAGRDPRLVFVFVGHRASSDDPEFRRLLETEGRGARVRALGERSDLVKLLPGFDLVALASHIEGFPNVLGEALACGVPAVSTDVGDAGRLAGPGGRVVAPGDEDALLEALLEISALGDVELADLGLTGRAHVETSFSLAKVVLQYEALYSDLVGEPCVV